MTSPNEADLPPRKWLVTDAAGFIGSHHVEELLRQGKPVTGFANLSTGKPTLLKLLSRISAPTHGEIRLKGRLASLLEVGAGFHYELTGRDNVFLSGAIMGMNRHEIRAKFDEIVELAWAEARSGQLTMERISAAMLARMPRRGT